MESSHYLHEIFRFWLLWSGGHISVYHSRGAILMPSKVNALVWFPKVRRNTFGLFERWMTDTVLYLYSFLKNLYCKNGTSAIEKYFQTLTDVMLYRPLWPEALRFVWNGKKIVLILLSLYHQLHSIALFLDVDICVQQFTEHTVLFLYWGSVCISFWGTFRRKASGNVLFM